MLFITERPRVWQLGWIGFLMMPLCKYPIINTALAKDDPFLIKLSIDHLEVAPKRHDTLQTFEGELWGGYDFHKAVLSWDIEREDGEISESEWGIFYRTGLSAFWDVDFGLRKDFKGAPSRNWGVISFSGLAPYHFNVVADLMVSNEGRWGASLEVEQEWMITQQWVLMPSIAMDVYAQQDEMNETGEGLSINTAIKNI